MTITYCKGTVQISQDERSDFGAFPLNRLAGGLESVRIEAVDPVLIHYEQVLTTSRVLQNMSVWHLKRVDCAQDVMEDQVYHDFVHTCDCKLVAGRVNRHCYQRLCLGSHDTLFADEVLSGKLTFAGDVVPEAQALVFA